MRENRYNKYFWVFVFAVAAAVVFFALPEAHGQTDGAEITVTWQAKTYAPPTFGGKALPSPGARVMATVNMIQGDRLVNLDQYEISWFFDGKLAGRAGGLKEIDFIIKNTPGIHHTLKVSVKKPGAEAVETVVRIPVARPEVVIRPQTEIKAGGNLVVEAVPYFFSAVSDKSLDFFWNVFGIKSQSRGNSISIKTPTISETTAGVPRISVTVQNKSRPEETARGSFVLKTK